MENVFQEREMKRVLDLNDPHEKEEPFRFFRNKTATINRTTNQSEDCDMIQEDETRLYRQGNDRILHLDLDIRTEIALAEKTETQIITVFTDGSVIGNGKASAKGGIGVHFPNKEIPDISACYRGRNLHIDETSGQLRGEGRGSGVVTNQRAELEAIRVAIATIDQLSWYKRRQVHIHLFTDSEYSIQALTNWVYKWVDNDWKTVNGKPVKNVDLIAPIFEMLSVHRVKFFHCAAHTQKTDPRSLGNAKADALATKATKMNK